MARGHLRVPEPPRRLRAKSTSPARCPDTDVRSHIHRRARGAPADRLAADGRLRFLRARHRGARTATKGTGKPSRATPPAVHPGAGWHRQCSSEGSGGGGGGTSPRARLQRRCVHFVKHPCVKRPTRIPAAAAAAAGALLLSPTASQPTPSWRDRGGAAYVDGGEAFRFSPPKASPRLRLDKSARTSPWRPVERPAAAAAVAARRSASMLPTTAPSHARCSSSSSCRRRCRCAPFPSPSPGGSRTGLAQGQTWTQRGEGRDGRETGEG
eukprot:356699-Chlamydomonas_euryale.AAC.4